MKSQGMTDAKQTPEPWERASKHRFGKNRWIVTTWDNHNGTRVESPPMSYWKACQTVREYNAALIAVRGEEE